MSGAKFPSLALTGLLTLFVVDCRSTEPATPTDNASGGTAASTSNGPPTIGGARASGGARTSGGTAIQGGGNASGGATTNNGGASTSGETTSSFGGSATMGGSASTGGSIMNGGASATAGGTTTRGGAAAFAGAKTTGGTAAFAGAKTTGGTAAVTGGANSVGAAAGTKAIGGAVGATGGSQAAGGTTATGGMPATFRNPLNTAFGSDPFMTYYQGNYYLAATTWGTTLTMKRGATIQALKNATTTVIWQDSTASRHGNMWAPEFYLLDNGAGAKRWYHFYTAGDGTDLGTQRPYVLESDGTDPMGPYHFKAQLLDYWAIDTSVLQVNNQLYLMFSAWQGATQNIWVIGMTNAWTVTGARTLLSQPTYAWEQEGTDSVNEGPIALYHGGRTFVSYSASQCASPGYKLGLLELIASNPLAASSWTKSASAVFQSANGAYGTGHNGFFMSPDGTENWLVYHAVANANGSCWTDRTTRIQKLTWSANGTPNFGTPLALSTDIEVPSGE